MIQQIKTIIVQPEVIRYFVVGFGTFIIDFSLLNFLVYIVEFDPIWFGLFSAANVISTSLALVITFTLNRWWTFGIKTSDKVLSQSSKFILTSMTVWLIHNATFGILVQVGIIHPIAKIMVMAVQMVVNFVLYKYVVFR